jgi:hypothetical protein
MAGERLSNLVVDDLIAGNRTEELKNSAGLLPRRTHADA